MSPALICTVGMQGRIQALKNGGAHIYRVSLVGSCGAHSTRKYLCTYNARHSRWVWGHASPVKFSNLDHMRVLLRLSETTITTQNLWQLDCNLWYGHLSEPLRNQPLYVRHCHRTVRRSCRFECFYVFRT